MKVNSDSMKLYAVTDSHHLNGRKLEEVVEDVLKGGATFLQLREKDMSHDELVKEAVIIKISKWKPSPSFKEIYKARVDAYPIQAGMDASISKTLYNSKRPINDTVRHTKYRYQLPITRVEIKSPNNIIPLMILVFI